MTIKKFSYKSPLRKQGFYKRGFTLLEILLAVALIVFGVTAVVGQMASAISNDMSVEGQIKALNLAQEKMEEIKNASSYSAIDGFAASRAEVAANGQPFHEYDREVLVSGTPKQVTVNVYWTFQGALQSVSLVTLLTDRGV